MIDLLLILLAGYASIGALFAILFILAGAPALDATAASAPLSVRVLFAPGALGLWPVLALRWATAHRKARRSQSP